MNPILKAGATKGKRQIKINAYTQAELIKLLVEGQSTLRELAEETGLHYVTVCEYVRELKRVGVLRLARMDPDDRGHMRCPVYRLGKGENAKRPPRLTGAERQARYRAKKKQLALLHMTAGITP